MSSLDYFDNPNEDLYEKSEDFLRDESAFLTSILDETQGLRKTQKIKRRLSQIDSILESFNEY